MKTGKGELAILKILRIGILRTDLKYIYINTLTGHINFKGEKKGENQTLLLVVMKSPPKTTNDGY